MERNLLKVHGSGNTFYLYEAANENEFNWVRLAKWLCDPSNEKGADGLLLVLPSKVADAKMRVINADGSEASMCGNGLRCVARYVCEKLGVTEAIIETLRANLRVKKEPAIFEELPTYAVEISPVSFDLDSLPMQYKEKKELRHQIIEEFSPTIQFTAVSVPNPHLIGIVNEHYIQHESHQFLLAKFLNSENEFCADGVNVSYVFPMADDQIFVRTYERGVGFTNACGTAMTASALVAKINGYVNAPKITVFNPGGFVQCVVQFEDEAYKLILIGNATVIGKYRIEISQEHINLLSCECCEESLQYEKCLDFVREQTKFFLNRDIGGA
ncbi:diaminopimelate epimerase [Solibacillus sp. FSL H8-0538]|uniref:diaminopimelate epimerase n=1 Tax=Solibacillus sp. FSL H8-0538 TaxID=2921400 RepID=UPI0030F65108